MTHSELWLTYQLSSRAHLPATAQLVDLEYQNHKLRDLEDILDHVFREGYVEAKYRPSTWWEKHDGQKVKNGHLVEDLLNQGVGVCQDSALKLVIEDVPTTLWFSYVYLNNPCGPVVTQRVKLETLPTRAAKMAHLTNYIFKQGYIAPRFRPVVHWQRTCGKKVEEHISVEDILTSGVGHCEDKALRFVIGELHEHHVHHTPDHHVHHTPDHHHHHHEHEHIHDGPCHQVHHHRSVQKSCGCGF